MLATRSPPFDGLNVFLNSLTQWELFTKFWKEYLKYKEKLMYTPKTLEDKKKKIHEELRKLRKKRKKRISSNDN